MNTNRLLGEGKSYYHAVTRCVGREYFFRGAKDKEVIRKIMRRLESLLGVKVITFCIMSNHIHLLLEVPDQEELPPLDEEELLKLLPSLYDSDYVLTVRQEFDRARELSTPELREERIAQILGKFEKRRGDLSTFMKEFKHRVTPLHQQETQPGRNPVGKPIQERVGGGERRGFAYHGCLYRSESGASRNGGATGGLSLVRICRGGGG